MSVKESIYVHLNAYLSKKRELSHGNHAEMFYFTRTPQTRLLTFHNLLYFLRLAIVF